MTSAEKASSSVAGMVAATFAIDRAQDLLYYFSQLAAADLLVLSKIDLLDETGELVVLHVMSQMSAGPGVRGEQLRTGIEKLIEESPKEALKYIRAFEKNPFWHYYQDKLKRELAECDGSVLSVAGDFGGDDLYDPAAGGNPDGEAAFC